MKGGQFRKLAEESLRHYGDDPWFFLRELAQNSRDAGAANIWVEADCTPGTERLLFEDDGCGMTFEAARTYLYKLYSSSKEDDETSAGMFGVGFWSVLRFHPVLVRVESRWRGQAWAVELDEGLEPRRIEPRLSHDGTCVILERPAQFETDEEFADQVRQGLWRACGHLRVKKARGRVLPVWFRDRQVSGPLSLECDVQMPFSQGRVDGVVGLAAEPSVELYVRGLPVWKGTVLEELSARDPDPVWRSDVGQGLAPVVKVNADSLTVVLSRTAVVDDRNLAEVRDVTRRAVERLVESYLNRSLGNRRLNQALTTVRQWIRSHAPALGVVLGLAALAWLLVWQDQHESAATQLAPPESHVIEPQKAADKPGTGDEIPGAFSSLPMPGGESDGGVAAEGNPDARPAGPVDYMTLRARMRYLGSQVDPMPAPSAPFLTWSPPTRLYWRILATRRFDSHLGFVGDVSEDEPVSNLRDFQCLRGCVRVKLVLPQTSGRIVLPVPTGYEVVKRSVLAEGKSVTPFAQSEDMVVIETELGVRSVEYTVGASWTTADASMVVGRPTLQQWPEEILDGLDPLCDAGSEAIGSWLAGQLVYDASQAVAGAFLGRKETSQWLEFVWQLRRGDCDVLNGLAVLALDYCGFPARLAVGFAGAEGHVIPGLHAWVEVAQGKSAGVPQAWRVLDLTKAARQATPDETPDAEPGQGAPFAATANSDNVEGSFGGDGIGDGAAAHSLGPAAQSPATPDAVSEAGDVAPAAVAVRSSGQSLSAGVDASEPSGAGQFRLHDSQQLDGGGPEIFADAAPEGWLSQGPLLWAAWRFQGLSLRGKLGVMAGVLAAALLLSLLLFSVLRRFRGKPGEAVTSAQADEVVAKLALRALVQPGVWEKGSQLFQRPLLPLLSGGKISLNTAMARSSRGRIYLGSNQNALVCHLKGGKQRVLIVEPGVLGEVVRRIPRTLDLDQIETLAKVADVGVAQEALAITRWLENLWQTSTGIRLLAYSSPAHPDVVRDFDLGGLTFRKGSPWRRTIVAVNLVTWAKRRSVPNMKAAQATMFEPERAYDLAQHITSHSLLMAPRSAQLRSQVLEALLRQGWGGGV